MKRTLSIFLTCVFLLGLLPTTVFAAGSGNKNIMLGTSQIEGGQASSVYFGNYQQSSNGSGGYNADPVKWRVLSNADGKLFLLADQNLDVKPYNSSYTRITWEKSTIRSWLNGYGASENTYGTDYSGDNFIDAAFSSAEQGAIAQTYVYNATQSDGNSNPNPSYSTPGGNNTTDKIFLLSIEEANNNSYFPSGNDSRKSTNTAYVASHNGMNVVGAADAWLLRSPGDSGGLTAASVLVNGGVNIIGVTVELTSYAVRPAFNLNLNSVLFTSAAVGGKAASGMDSGLTAIGDYTGSGWKLTLLDSSRNNFSISNVTANGGTISFSYSGAQTGTNEYISAVVADNGAITHYGRILQLDGTTSGTNGTVSLSLPTGVTLSSNTKLYVFNEQYNGGANDNTKLTDYASQLIEVDTTAPALSNGTATRDSESTATVKFTSDEAGTYYYAVVDSGAAAPSDLTASGTSGSCVKGENTINLTTLTAGKKDIYIVVKDAADNVSETLKITIPAYIAPSYGVSASPGTLNFGSETVGYEAAPATQTVTVTNTGNQNVTVTLPTGTNYTITAGAGFSSNTATLAPNGTAAFTVQPNTGLAVGSHNETLSISGSNNTSASVFLSFTVTDAAHNHQYGTGWETNADKHWHECSCGAKADEADHVYDDGQDTTCNVCDYVRTVAPTTYTLTVDLKGGSGSSTTGGEYAEGAVIHINAGTRSDYRFSGWTSSNGGSFADASSASTTFTMPAADTMITANWQYNGGGGGSYTPPSTPTYPPTVEKPGEGGGTPAVSPSNPKPGDTVTVKPKPDGGYEVDKITVTDKNGKPVEVTVKPDGTYTFQQPNGKVTIEVTYKEINTPWNNPFADVSEGDWYYEAVRFVHERGLMNGYSDGRFGPNDTLSRAQLAQILFNKEGRPGVDHLLDFSDVAGEAWYTEAVRWAASQGIVGGYGNGTFGPNDPITREQLAVMLWRYSGSPAATNKELHFNDTDEISGFALEAMRWAVENGILNGYGDGRLGPQGQATRAQVAQMLKNFIEKG